MEIKKILFIFIFVLVSCGGQGTEVLSVQNPNETPKPKKFETVNYNVIIDLPEDWTFIEYSHSVNPGEEAFIDDDVETQIVAYFEKKDLAYFTIFAAKLDEGQSIFDYVRERRPTGDYYYEVADAGGVEATMLLYSQEEPGERDGYVFDLYFAIGDDVLWMRGELLGSEEEQQITEDEFWEMVESIEFET